MKYLQLLLCCFSAFFLIAEEKDWDVANPPDETFEIEIDTDEGTWMSLDVSPDGKTIAFDLLGDIYTMPFTGGKATLISGGLPWEMQPRFSPDGQWIAFTSDRGGGDNIWVMKTDGSERHQITKESFRLLNSPDWTPDGNYLIARKHYTKTRSLGAGELWLYHKTGGTGLPLVTRPNDQKDLGEPAFSPDGRHLFYSQDTTPGPVFEYSKDPEPGIYTIFKYDRERGETETVIRGNGGAIRPTPSPDGKQLAFIRRNDYKTALYIHDLQSGENTLIYNGLDRDMQETWAIHGVYAGISWTPDNQSLVFWSGGKIHRVNVSSKEVTNIPFQVKTKHTMVKGLRFPVEVAPDKFDVKMLRWVNVSPDKKQVVYSALGNLYTMDIPKGKPKRLTNETNGFEYYPSFSKDGQTIVYIHWNDQELATIRTVSAKGGTPQLIQTEKGHYIAPKFSPDGKTIVYQKVGGGHITSPLWSKNQGIYQIPSAGGEAKLIIEDGSDYHFGPENNRIYYTTVGPEIVRTLNSIDLSGKEQRTHVSSKMGRNFQISPDGKWLAYKEKYSVYLLPFTKTGKTFMIDTNLKSLPITKVSADAGEHIHWSADAKTIFWSLGDRLYERNIQESFSFVEGAPKELPEAESEGIMIGFEAEYAKPETVIAIKNAKIITMKGDEIIENGTIVVKGNRIKAIGPASKVKVPKNARILDATGKVVMPGLVDVHEHASYAASEMTPQRNWRLYAGLTFGVTTIHNPSSDTAATFQAAEMAKAGKILSARIFSTGTILYGATVPEYTAHVESIDDARFHIRRRKAVGAFSVKSYNQPRRDQRQQIVKAARENQFMVVPEGGSLFQHNMTMIADGHTGVEHSIPVANAYKDVIQFWSQTQVGYTPTLGVGYGGIYGENYWYDKHDVWKNERLKTFVPDYILRPRAKRRTKSPDNEYNHFKNAAICKKLTDAGVLVHLGAHGQREGLAAHWEIWMFVQGGMTPHEALKAGTINGAIYLGLDGDVGSLEKGKLADLIILNKDPLTDIYNTESIEEIMLNGMLYNSKDMNKVGGQPREKFFFEEHGHLNPDTTTLQIQKCGGHCNH